MSDTRELRHKLARRFYTFSAIVAACVDAGIDYTRVNLNGAPIDIWFDALRNAELMLREDRDRAIATLTALAESDAPQARCPHCGGAP